MPSLDCFNSFQRDNRYFTHKGRPLIKRLKDKTQVLCLDLLWPDAKVEVEASLQQQVLDVVGVDGEVEVQRVPQQLVGLLITLSARSHTTLKLMQFNGKVYCCHEEVIFVL